MANKRIDYEKLYKLEAQELSKVSYSARLKVVLGMKIKDLKGTPIYGAIAQAFEGQVDDNMTMDEARIYQLMRSVMQGGSIGLRAIELSYKLDGSLNSPEVDVDLDEIDSATEGIN